MAKEMKTPILLVQKELIVIDVCPKIDSKGIYHFRIYELNQELTFLKKNKEQIIEEHI